MNINTQNARKVTEWNPETELVNVFHKSAFMFRVYNNGTVQIWTDTQETDSWTDCHNLLGIYSLSDARNFYRDAEHHALQLINL